MRVIVTGDPEARCSRCGRKDDDMFVIHKSRCEGNFSIWYSVGRRSETVTVKIEPIMYLCTQCVKELLGDLWLMESL